MEQAGTGLSQPLLRGAPRATWNPLHQGVSVSSPASYSYLSSLLMRHLESATERSFGGMRDGTVRPLLLQVGHRHPEAPGDR